MTNSVFDDSRIMQEANIRTILLNVKHGQVARSGVCVATQNLVKPTVRPHRQTLEGILWVARTGAPWRDLPTRFGKWSTVYQRFRRWVEAGVFDDVFGSLVADLNVGVIMVDRTFVKVHQHATGAPKEAARPMTAERRRPLGSVAAG